MGPDIASLSARERTVLRLVQRGLQTDEIARELDRSPNTIENQIASARRKLGGVTRRQAARMLHDLEHGALSAHQPFALSDAGIPDEPRWRDAELLREDRAIFVVGPPRAHETSTHETGTHAVPARRPLSTIALIVVTTIGLLIILAATPTLVASFKTFTAWLIRTFF